jgi:hypothetical protein
VLAHVPLRRVIPHTDANRIPALCDLLLADFSDFSDFSDWAECKRLNV